MNKISIATARVNIPTATTPAAPVSVTLNPVNNSIRYLIMVFSEPVSVNQDIILLGWRMRDRSGLIVPDNGSAEAGWIIPGGEANWAGMPTLCTLELPFYGREIAGAPFEITFDFYNNEDHDHQASIFLATSEREQDVNDLIKEMKADRDELRRMVTHANTDQRTS